MSDGANNPVRYFGRQVRKERLAAGWTLAEFGQRIGYDPAHISRIESGKRPATEVFAQMCDQAFPHRDRLVQRVLRGVPHLDRHSAVVPQLGRARAARRDTAELVPGPRGRTLANRGLRPRDPRRRTLV